MAVNIQVRRDTAANWALNDPTPASGELCWTTDTAMMKIGNGVDPYSFLPYWPADDGGSVSRLEYGNIQLTARENTLLTNIAFIPAGERMAADIKLNYVQYKNCLWDIQELSPGIGSWNGLRFPTAADLYTFLAANAEPSAIDPTRYAHTIIAKVYDNVDADNDKIHKIYGQNTFLSILKGRKSYKKGKSCVDATSVNWPFLADWVEDIGTRNIGLPNDPYAAGHEKAVWLPTNTHKTHGLPVDGFSMQHTASFTDRWCYDAGLGTWHVIDLGTVWHNSLAGGKSKVYCSRNIDTQNLWDWYESSWGSVLSGTSNRNSTTLCLYHMVNSGNPNQHSVFAKPVGVDALGMNWFDTASYDLLAVYFSKNSTPIIRKIWNFSQRDQWADLLWVVKQYWGDPRLGSTSLSFSMTGMEYKDVRFMLRNTVTLNVSELSIPYVHMAQKHRNAPLKAEVRR